MVRICLNVLVGIPASGKTTYCQQIAASPNRTFNVVHLCYDTYIEIDAKFDDFCTEAGSYKIRRLTLLNNIETILHAVMANDLVRLNGLLSTWEDIFKKPLDISYCSGTSQDYLFLIDDNNYYSSMRWEWAKLAKKLSVGFFETYFDISPQVAIERNEKRKHPVARDVITRMWTRLEKPCKDLCRWEHNVICVQNQFNTARVMARVEQCLANPEQATDAQPSPAFPPMEQSKVHKLDVLIRKAISKNIFSVKDSMSKSDLKSYAEALQERKKAVLEQMRNGKQNYSDEQLPGLVEELF